MKNPERTTLLINLSMHQANLIRAQARKQDRTISAYVLRAVMNRIEIEQRVDKGDENFVTNYFDKARGPR
jgi:hypothetical protein